MNNKARKKLIISQFQNFARDSPVSARSCLKVQHSSPKPYHWLPNNPPINDSLCSSYPKPFQWRLFYILCIEMMKIKTSKKNNIWLFDFKNLQGISLFQPVAVSKVDTLLQNFTTDDQITINKNYICSY